MLQFCIVSRLVGFGRKSAGVGHRSSGVNRAEASRFSAESRRREWLTFKNLCLRAIVALKTEMFLFLLRV